MRRNQDNPLINAIRGNVPVPRITAPMQSVQVTPRRRGQGPTPQPQRNVVAEQGQRLREQSVQQGRQQWQQLASDPNSIIYVMREVDNRLGTSIGDEARELVKSYALARANRNNSDPRLARYAGEALAMLQAEGGREQLQREIQQFRQRRVDVGPPAPIDRTTRIGQQEFTRGLAQQAGAELEQLQAGQLTPDIVEILREDARAQDEARNPMVRAAATTLGAINPILGSGIQALYGDMAQTNVNRLVDNPAAMMRGDAGVASVIANELVSPATRMTRRFAGPVSEQSEAARAAIALGDIAGQVVMSGGGGGVPAAIARFAALDLPGFGELIATTGSPQAAAEMVGGMARQGLDLRTYADPNIPLDQKIGNAGMALAVAAGSYSALAGARNAMRGASRGLAKTLSGLPINRAESTSLQRVASAIQQSDDSIVPPPVLVQQLVERGVPERDAVNVAIINQAGERAIGGTMPAEAGEAMARSQVPQVPDVPVRQEPEPTVGVAERAQPTKQRVAKYAYIVTLDGDQVTRQNNYAIPDLIMRAVHPDDRAVVTMRTVVPTRALLEMGVTDEMAYVVTSQRGNDRIEVMTLPDGTVLSVNIERYDAGAPAGSRWKRVSKSKFADRWLEERRLLTADADAFGTLRVLYETAPTPGKQSYVAPWDRGDYDLQGEEYIGFNLAPEVSQSAPVSETGNIARTGKPNAPIQEETPSAAQGVLGREEPQPQEQVGLPQARERAGGEGPQAETQAQVAPRTYESLMAEADNLRGAEKRAKIKEARDLRIQEAASGGRMEGASGINPTDLREFYEYAKSYIEDGVDWVRGLRSDFGQDVEPYIESIQRQLDEEGIQVRQVGEEAPQAGQRRPEGTRGMDRAEEAREGGVPAQGEARPQEGVVANPEDPNVVGSSRQFIDREREQAGLPPLPTEGVTREALLEYGKRNSTVENTQAALAKLETNELISAEEMAIVHHYHTKLRERNNTLVARSKNATPEEALQIAAELQKLDAEVDRITRFMQRATSRGFHQVGMAAQIVTDTSMNLLDLRADARARNMGQELSATVKAKLDDISAKYEGALLELDAARKEIADLLKRLGARTTGGSGRGQVMRDRALNQLRKLGLEVAEDAGQGVVRAGVRGGRRAGAVSLPDVDLRVERTRRYDAIRSLARSYLYDDPMLGIDDIVQSIQRDVPGISTDDVLMALSNKYREARLEADVQQRRAQRLMREIEDAALYREMTTVDKAKRQAGDFLNATMRGLISGFDLSFAFIQGLPMALTKEYWQAWSPTIKILRSLGEGPQAAERFAAEMASDPMFSRAMQAKLGVADMHGGFSTAEELFAGSFIRNMAESPIPGVRQYFRALRTSEAMYTTFLSALRFELFKNLARLDPDNAEYLRDVARTINIMTGRGDGKFAEILSSPYASAAFYAPRYTWSGWQMASAYPFLKAGTKQGRQQTAKMYAKPLALMATAYALAQMSGSEVDTDPRATSFGRITLPTGHVVDLFGKWLQPYRFLSQMALGRISLEGKYTAPSEIAAGATLGQYLTSKASPAFNVAKSATFGPTTRDPLSDEFRPSTPEEVAARFLLPMAGVGAWDQVRAGNELFWLQFFGINVDEDTPEQQAAVQRERQRAPAIGLPPGPARLLGQEPPKKLPSTRTQQPAPQRSSGPLMRQPLQ